MPETVQPKIVKNLLGTDIITNYWANTDKLRLFQNDLVPDNDTDVGDLTIADFTGYADVTVVSASWSRGQIPDFREQEIWFNGGATFTQTGTTITNTVYGWYIVDTAGTVLKAVRRFNVPILFDTTGRKLFLKPLFNQELTADDHVEVLN